GARFRTGQTTISVSARYLSNRIEGRSGKSAATVLLKQSGGDIFIVASAAYAKQGASESRMPNYFETCCSCRRRTNCVEKTAASKPMIGKNVLVSGIGLTPVAAVHSSNPPLPWPAK